MNTKGPARKQAAEEASSELLKNYKQKWNKAVPVNLSALAFTLNARIERIKEVNGGARLVPIPKGFLVLVSDKLEPARHRTSVAHELAHTLFYSQSAESPTRLIPHSADEEYFCFDVARRLLAPSWLLEYLGLHRESDLVVTFETFAGKLQLSKSISAQLIFNDYELVRGAAGRWTWNGHGWALKKASFWANPAMRQTERKFLRIIMQEALAGTRPSSTYRVITIKENRSDTALVLVEKR